MVVFWMPVIGVEPIRYRYRGILSPVRLPIPPHRQVDYFEYYKKKKGTCQHFFEKIKKKFWKKYLESWY